MNVNFGLLQNDFHRCVFTGCSYKITKNLDAIWQVLAVEMHVAGPGVCMYHYQKFLMG